MKLYVYILKRLLLGVFTFFIMVSLIFFIIRVVPGDPVEIMLAYGAPPALRETIRHEMGLDQPIHLQFLSYLGNILQGDLGKSMWSRRSVIGEILSRFPTTIELTIVALTLSLVFGVIGGVVSATQRNRLTDHILRLVSITMNAVPIFFLAIILQLVFAVYLGWFPVFGRVGRDVTITRITGLNMLDSILTGNLRGLFSSATSLVLPALALAFNMLPAILRVTRANMIGVLGEKYVQTATAKGLPPRVVLFKHALRNAVLPIVTLGGMYFAALIGCGAIITESVFALPGIGRLLVDSAANRDFPLLQGCLIFFAIIVLVVSIAVDIIYCLLDPRIRLGESTK